MNTTKTMKTHLKLAILALFSAINLQPAALLAQGDLTPPPGAPMPTMKTLAQIESRTAIDGSTTPVVLSQPGSYYLTTNLTVTSGNAISIAANGVTLDLNGFTLSSTAPSAAAYGIQISGGLQDITIMNGHIRGGVTNSGGVYSGSGFAYGISYTASEPVNVHVSRISVSGCLYHGINLAISDATVVEACSVRTVGTYGIRASIIRTSSANDCGSSAISGDQVSDCHGESSNGYGVFAATAQNCYGSSNSSDGISAKTAQNCKGSSNSGSGVSATTTLNCHGSSGSGSGITATTAQNSYGYSDGGTGLNASRAAINCYGESVSGTQALDTQNAAFCTGYRPGGTAIRATIANGCYAAAGITSITHKYNMP